MNNKFLKYFDPLTTPRNIVKEYFREYEAMRVTHNISLEYNTRDGPKCSTDRLRVLMIRGCKCAVCGMAYRRLLQVHHIVPLGDKGTHDIENEIVLCSGCHQIVHCSIKNGDLSSIRGSVPEAYYEKLEKLVNYKNGDWMTLKGMARNGPVLEYIRGTTAGNGGDC